MKIYCLPLVILLLAGCGQPGPLYLPVRPVPVIVPPAKTQPAPSSSTIPASNPDNSEKKP